MRCSESQSSVTWGREPCRFDAAFIGSGAFRILWLRKTFPAVFGAPEFRLLALVPVFGGAQVKPKTLPACFEQERKLAGHNLARLLRDSGPLERLFAQSPRNEAQQAQPLRWKSKEEKQ